MPNTKITTDRINASDEKSEAIMLVDVAPALLLLLFPFDIKSRVDADREGGDVTERNEAATSTDMPITDSILIDLLTALKKSNLFSLCTIKGVFGLSLLKFAFRMFFDDLAYFCILSWLYLPSKINGNASESFIMRMLPYAVLKTAFILCR